MQEIVINTIYGGFGLSKEAQKLLKQKTSFNSLFRLRRDNEFLIEVVRQLGRKANSKKAELKIVTIPDGVSWQIEDHNGLEWIAEVHRIWN